MRGEKKEKGRSRERIKGGEERSKDREGEKESRGRRGEWFTLCWLQRRKLLNFRALWAWNRESKPDLEQTPMIKVLWWFPTFFFFLVSEILWLRTNVSFYENNRKSLKFCLMQKWFTFTFNQFQKVFIRWSSI